jgi:hypothetical protein
MLSDPKGREGIFWKLFQLSQKKNVPENGQTEWPHDDILALQLPTWRMNPNPEFEKSFLEKTERSKDPINFLTSWAARFMGSEGSRFFDEGKIDQCIDVMASETIRPDASQVYYIHLDPATTSHNYALAMVHANSAQSHGGTRRKLFVDLIKVWSPTENGPVKLADVEQYIKMLCSKYRVASVTFDSFQSQQTIQNLVAVRINAFETPFRTSYLMAIYGELKHLINEGDLVLYPHEQLIGELKCLRYRVVNRGFKRFYDPKSEFRSDDIADALAGAAYQCLHGSVTGRLPRSVVVWTGRR